MNELEFKQWLSDKGKNKKMQSDCISRLKRIERELNCCDIDSHYQQDGCRYLKSLFENCGDNDKMRKYPQANFPIGRYYMSTYRYALNLYIQFCNDVFDN